MISYQVWTVRMEAYFDANDIWKALKQVYRVPPLPNNLIIAKIKNHKKRKRRTSKAGSILFVAVLSPTIFNRIMTSKTFKEIQDFLKQEYERNERIEGIQVLNLIREFEMQKAKNEKFRNNQWIF
jgi:hypothetical protein